MKERTVAVYVVRIEKGMHGALERIMHRFVAPGDLMRGVFLKPNIVFPVKDRSDEITRRAIVEQVIAVLRAMKRDVDIVIGEGVAAGANAHENFKISGYADLARKLRVPLIDLESAERTEVDWKHGKLSLPSIALARLYISLPVLKLTSAAGISGAMKNQKGLVLAEIKKQFHRMGLHEPLVELNRIVQPHLTIIGCNRHFKKPLIIAGTSTIELDSHIIDLLHIAPPENIRLAREQLPIPQPFVVQGDTPYKPRTRYKNPNRPFRRYLRLRVWAGAGACSMCRRRLTEIKSPAMLFRRSGLLTALKLISYMFTGADIIIGSDARPVPDSYRLVCFGACTKKWSESNTCRFVHGCPPSFESLSRYL